MCNTLSGVSLSDPWFAMQKNNQAFSLVFDVVGSPWASSRTTIRRLIELTWWGGYLPLDVKMGEVPEHHFG